MFVPGEPRQWRVGIQNAMDAKRDAKQAQDREREDRRLKKQEQQESDWKRELADYLKDIHPSGDTQNGIVKSTSLSVKSAPIAIRHLKAEGRLERCDVAQGNNQSYHGWRYVHVNGSK